MHMPIDIYALCIVNAAAFLNCPVRHDCNLAQCTIVYRCWNRVELFYLLIQPAEGLHGLSQTVYLSGPVITRTLSTLAYSRCPRLPVFNKKASIRWQDSAPPISGYWPTSLVCGQLLMTKQQLRRPVFCSCRTTSVEHAASTATALWQSRTV